MEQYTVAKASEKLGIHPDTLRYYDKIKLLSPKRGENRYRFYSEEDLSHLMYIEVLKYANFSLSEINTIIHGSCENLTECRKTSMQLMERKRKELIEKIHHLEEIVKITNKTIAVFGTIEEKGFSVVDELTIDIYQKIKKQEGEKANE